jgi:hypothetical protein
MCIKVIMGMDISATAIINMKIMESSMVTQNQGNLRSKVNGKNSIQMFK